MPRQPSLPTMLVPALGTDDAKPRLTRGNNQTTSHPRTPRSPSRAQDHVHTVKEHSISFLTSPAPSYMPVGARRSVTTDLLANGTRTGQSGRDRRRVAEDQREVGR